MNNKCQILDMCVFNPFIDLLQLNGDHDHCHLDYSKVQS